MEIKVPQINTNDERVDILQWNCSDGDYVKVGKEFVELGTSKANVFIASEHEGYICCYGNKGDSVAVGATLASYHTNKIEALEAKQIYLKSTKDIDLAPKVVDKKITFSKETFQNLNTRDRSYGFVKFSPEALRYIQQNNIDIEKFKNMGLITLDMVIEKPLLSEELVDDNLKNLRSTPISSLKRAEISALTLGESGNISSTLHFKFYAAPLREKIRLEGLYSDLVLPVILYEIAQVLPEYPLMMSFFSSEKIYYYDDVNIGIAVDLGKGLKVVNISNADKLDSQAFYDRIVDILNRYIEGQISVSELAGSSITVTDLSSFHVGSFVPLLNGHQSAIIGIGTEQGHAGETLVFSVTFDHRVLSGREVGLFMGQVLKKLQLYGEQAPALEQSLSLAIGNTCSRCGIDNHSYHKEFKRDAVMTLIVEEDSKISLLCHRCTQGY